MLLNSDKSLHSEFVHCNGYPTFKGKAYEKIKDFIIYICTLEYLISLHPLRVVSDTEIHKCKYLHFDFTLICSCCKTDFQNCPPKKEKKNEKRKEKQGASQVC